MLEDFLDDSDCLKPNRVDVFAGNQKSLHSFSRQIISHKPFPNLFVRRFKNANSIPVPFLLDTGSDVSLLPKVLFDSLGRPPEKQVEKLSVTTVRGDFEAELHEINVNFPKFFASTKFVKIQVGVVDATSPLKQHWITRWIRKVFRHQNATELSGSAVKLFGEGKIGIIAAKDFVKNFDYLHSNVRFYVRKNGQK